MKKYTLKERKKNGVVLRLTGAEWNKIAALHDGEWTTHNTRGEAIGVRYGCTLHIHKDGLSGEFDWVDVNNCKELKDDTVRPWFYLLEALQVSLVAALSAALVYVLIF